MLNKNHHSIVPHLLKLIVISSLLFSSAARLSAATITPQDIVKRANDIRSEHALAPLQENHLLTLAAYNKANDMREKGYFAHHSPDGKEFYQWITDVGYEYTYAGENLAKDFRNPDDLMLAWMDSPTHRANILDTDFCEIGIAQLTDTNGAALVVQVFGCRDNVTRESRALSNAISSTTTKGYTISVPREQAVSAVDKQQNALTNSQEPEITTENGADKQQSGNTRLLASGMLILFTVTMLSVMERRRHYHHVYRIPIKIKNKTNTVSPSSPT